MEGRSFGLDENTSYIDENEDKFIRVKYPKGSISSGATKTLGTPLGGAQFYTKGGITPTDQLILSYKVRFSDNFDFVRGGKLPGLFGGDRNASGQRIPDGKSGWSTRFMWRYRGNGEVYSYMPSSKTHGSSLGRGKWKFTPGVWEKITQRVTLNDIGKENGKVEVYLNDKKVYEEGNLVFRTVDTLKIDGMFFSTFFGGSSKEWASKEDVYTDFKDFKIEI